MFHFTARTIDLSLLIQPSMSCHGLSLSVLWLRVCSFSPCGCYLPSLFPILFCCPSSFTSPVFVLIPVLHSSSTPRLVSPVPCSPFLSCVYHICVCPCVFASLSCSLMRLRSCLSPFIFCRFTIWTLC